MGDFSLSQTDYQFLLAKKLVEVVTTAKLKDDCNQMLLISFSCFVLLI